MTFKEIYPLWSSEKKLYVKESTMSSYNQLIKNHVLPYWGEIEPEIVTNNMMQDFVMILVQKGLSNKSACDICIAVKMMIDFNSEKFNFPKSLFKLRYPTTNEKSYELEVYTSEEQKKIFKYVIENPTSENLAFALTLSTGMRIGEICALQWGNIDIEKKQINVHSTMQRIYAPDDENTNKFDKKIKTKIIFDTPKTASSYRIVPIANFILPLVKAYKKTIKDAYFVCTGDKKYVEPRVFRCHYYNFITNEVKLGRCIKFHGLRHSFASKLISSGVDAKTVSKILGHSKVEMTMNLYVHPSDENKSDAVNKAMKSIFK